MSVCLCVGTRRSVGVCVVVRGGQGRRNRSKTAFGPSQRSGPLLQGPSSHVHICSGNPPAANKKTSASVDALAHPRNQP